MNNLKDGTSAMNFIGAFNKSSFLKTLIISSWLLFNVAEGYTQSTYKANRKFELVVYNFGSLGELSPLNQIALLKKAGYKGIILNSESNADSSNLNVFLDELRNDKQFKIHAVMARYNFTDPLQKREGWKTIIDRIAHKGIELWFVFGKKTDGITDSFIEAKLKEVVEYSKAKQVSVILYPHSNCYIASSESALPFVKKINDTNLKLAVHLCHEIRAGNGSRINEVFEHVKNYIGAVTVSGTDSVADFSKPILMDNSTIKPIGQGNFNMNYFIEALRKSQYKGYVGFINFKIEDKPEEYLWNSIQVWRKLNKIGEYPL